MSMRMKSLFILTLAIMACFVQAECIETPSMVHQETNQESESFTPEPITNSSNSNPPGEKAYIFKYNQIFTNVVYVSGASGTGMPLTGGVITAAAILLVMFSGI